MLQPSPMEAFSPTAAPAPIRVRWPMVTRSPITAYASTVERLPTRAELATAAVEWTPGELPLGLYIIAAARANARRALEVISSGLLAFTLEAKSPAMIAPAAEESAAGTCVSSPTT